MSEPNDERIGTRREFEIRDDDRENDRLYSRDRANGTLLLILAAVALIVLGGAYLAIFGTGHPKGASVPAPIVRP